MFFLTNAVDQPSGDRGKRRLPISIQNLTPLLIKVDIGLRKPKTRILPLEASPLLVQSACRLIPSDGVFVPRNSARVALAGRMPQSQC